MHRRSGGETNPTRCGRAPGSRGLLRYRLGLGGALSQVTSLPLHRLMNQMSNTARTVDTHGPETCHSAFAKCRCTAIVERIIMKLVCKMISTVDYHVFGYEITMYYYAIHWELSFVRYIGAVHWGRYGRGLAMIPLVWFYPCPRKCAHVNKCSL